MSDSRLPPRSILSVAEEVIAQVRKDERMDEALDAYAPGHDNAHVRWLSKLRGYEVTLRFDAATFDRDAALTGGRMVEVGGMTKRDAATAGEAT